MISPLLMSECCYFFSPLLVLTQEKLSQIKDHQTSSDPAQTRNLGGGFRQTHTEDTQRHRRRTQRCYAQHSARNTIRTVQLRLFVAQPEECGKFKGQRQRVEK